MSNLEQLRLLRRCRNVLYLVQRECHIGGADAQELEQEAALALAELPDGLSDSYCVQRALWRAIRWVRRERHTRGSVEISHEPDLVKLIDSGRWLKAWC